MTEEDEEIQDSSGTGTTSRRLTDAEFAKIREFYELGTKSMVELADEFNVSRQALSRRFKIEGVIKGSRAHELAKAAGDGLKKREEDENRFAVQQPKWIEETRYQGYQALKRAELLTHKLIIEAKTAGKDYADVSEDIKVLERYGRIIRHNIESRLNLLQANDYVDEEDLPSLVVEDLTDEAILEHHKRNGTVPDDMTVEEMLDEQLKTLREIGMESEDE